MTTTTPIDGPIPNAATGPAPGAAAVGDAAAEPGSQRDAAPGVLAPAVVYLLADHLDAVLARGEDLLAATWRPVRIGRCTNSITDHQSQQRHALETIRTLEMVLISRALKARERAKELAARDTRFAPLARVFASATVALEVAAREAGDVTACDFETGDSIVAYLRGRGMVAADTAALDDCGAIIVNPGFLVARQIELGPLLDLTGGFLDALEIHYDLYPEVDAPIGHDDPASVLAPDSDLAPASAAD